MKVLVSTTKTQQFRSSDFSFTNDGEILKMGFTCDSGARASADGCCGCQRSFTGIDTRKGTTTGLVVERPDSERDDIINQMVLSEMRAYGFNEGDRAALTRDAENFLSDMEDFEAGAVVENRKGEFYERRCPH